MYNYDMKTYNDKPNFSVVVPNNCNCNCRFCFDKCRDIKLTFDDWFNKFVTSSKYIPAKFTQVSVTGGEPTLLDCETEFPMLMEFLSSKFGKVVVTTNGARLNKQIAYLSLAKYVNISYHGSSKAESDRTFGCGVSPMPSSLRDSISQLRALGTKVRLQRVFTYKPELHDVFNYIKFAKEMGANDIAIRMDISNKDGLNGTWIPLPLSKAVRVDTCPVCANWMFTIGDMNVHFKAGVAETNTNVPYELIYTKDGEFSTTWNTVTQAILQVTEANDKVQKSKPREVAENQRSSCGSGDCNTSDGGSSGCGG